MSVESWMDTLLGVQMDMLLHVYECKEENHFVHIHNVYIEPYRDLLTQI